MGVDGRLSVAFSQWNITWHSKGMICRYRKEHEMALAMYHSVENYSYKTQPFMFFTFFKMQNSWLASLLAVQKQAPGEIWLAGKNLCSCTNTHTLSFIIVVATCWKNGEVGKKEHRYDVEWVSILVFEWWIRVDNIKD